MKQVFHHYEKWEEIPAGMWRNVSPSERQEYLSKAQSLMINTSAFETAMSKASYAWPYSCEHHLTSGAFNRQAWMGHAGCCLETGSPEDVTRLAWHTLSQEQQDLANAAADRVIANWERRYKTSLEIDTCQNMALELTF